MPYFSHYYFYAPINKEVNIIRIRQYQGKQGKLLREPFGGRFTFSSEKCWMTAIRNQRSNNSPESYLNLRPPSRILLLPPNVKTELLTSRRSVSTDMNFMDFAWCSILPRSTSSELSIEITQSLTRQFSIPRQRKMQTKIEFVSKAAHETMGLTWQVFYLDGQVSSRRASNSSFDKISPEVAIAMDVGSPAWVIESNAEARSRRRVVDRPS